LIIVEGPDGGGKTTLLNKLQAQFDLPVAPRVVSKDTEAMVDLVKWTEVNVGQGFQSELYDRHRLVSEPIYGSITRVTAQPGFDDPVWLQRMNFLFYEICEPLIIYCLPPLWTVVANVNKSMMDNAVVQPFIPKIYRLYAAKAASDVALAGSILYNYRDPYNLREIIDRVDTALRLGRNYRRA